MDIARVMAGTATSQANDCMCPQDESRSIWSLVIRLYFCISACLTDPCTQWMYHCMRLTQSSTRA